MVTAAWTEPDRAHEPAAAVRRTRRGGDARSARTGLRVNPRRPPEHVIDRDPRFGCPATPAIWSRNSSGARKPRRLEAAQRPRRGRRAGGEILRKLLDDQRARIAKRERSLDDPQLSIDSTSRGRAERAATAATGKRSMSALPAISSTEPERVRRSYDVVADRLEIVGLVHLWPKSN